MMHRVACCVCRQHRPLTLETCPSCGSTEWKTIKATAGDVAVVERDVVAAAEALDAALGSGTIVTRTSGPAKALSECCRELALTRAGIVCR
jgi:RNA polymerase subunit RPABC4/transcription elongation factor Spt4